MLWICTGFLLSTIHAVFPLHFLWCLFTTPTLTGNFSAIHLLCPDAFSKPCLFSKPVFLLWDGLVAVSHALWRKVITWPRQPVSPRLFLVPASQWSLHGIIGKLFGVRQSPALIFWQLFKQRHCAVGGTSKRCNKLYLYYKFWSVGYQNKIWQTKQLRKSLGPHEKGFSFPGWKFVLPGERYLLSRSSGEAQGEEMATKLRV